MKNTLPVRAVQSVRQILPIVSVFNRSILEVCEDWKVEGSVKDAVRYAQQRSGMQSEYHG